MTEMLDLWLRRLAVPLPLLAFLGLALGNILRNPKPSYQGVQTLVLFASFVIAIFLVVPFVRDHLRARRIRNALAGRIDVSSPRTREDGLAFECGGCQAQVTLASARNDNPSRTLVTLRGADPLLALRLSAQTDTGLARVRAGLALDVQVGDPELDDRFIIEGAPSELVKRTLLDPSVRAGLLTAAPQLFVKNGNVDLSVDKWDKIQVLVELASNTAKASRNAAAQLEESRAQVAQEVAELDHVDAARELRAASLMIWIGQAILLLMIGVLTASALGMFHSTVSLGPLIFVAQAASALGAPPMLGSEIAMAAGISYWITLPAAVRFKRASMRLGQRDALLPVPRGSLALSVAAALCMLMTALYEPRRPPQQKLSRAESVSTSAQSAGSAIAP